MPPQNQNLPATQNNRSLQAILAEPRFADRFKEVLGQRAPQFVSSLVQIGRELDDCEPMSVIAAGMTAATLDLPINKNLGFAWIIPYKTKLDGRETKLAQFQMGYKGLVQLALRTGQYQNLNVCEVFAGELAEHNKLTGTLKLDPSKKEKDAKVIGYAAYLKLVTGFEHAEYWTYEEVEEHAREYSQAFRAAIQYKKKDAPWMANFDDMAKKTVLSMLIRKWGPMTVQLQKAVTHDQGVQVDIDSEVQYMDNKPEIKLAENPALPGASADSPTVRDNPNDSLQKQMKADGVSGAQVLTVLKTMGLADANADDVFALSDPKINQVLDAWPNLLAQFKAVK